MRIVTLSGSHLMGATFVWKPDALNFVSGRNDAGKTRLARAIALSLLGFVPGKEVDRTAQDIYRKLASGPRMDVESCFENGSCVHRSWEEKGGKVRMAHHVPRELDGATPLVMLDASDYFTRRARGRIELVFSVAKIDADIPVTEIADAISAALKEAGVATGHPIAAPGVQQWVETALEMVEAARSDAAAEVRRYTGTLAGLAEMQLDDRPATRSVAAIDKDIGATQSERALKLARHVALEADIARYDNEVAPRRIELEAEIRDAGDPPAEAADFAQLRRDQDLLTTRLANARQADRVRGQWEEEDDARRREVGKRERELSAIPDPSAQIERLEKEVAALEAKTAKKCAKCKQPLRTMSDVTDLDVKRSSLTELRAARTRREELARAIAELSAGAPEPLAGEDVAAVEAALKAVEDSIARYTALGQVSLWRQELEQIGPRPDHSAELAQIESDVRKLDDRETALREERKAAESDRADRQRMAQAQTSQAAAVAKEERMKHAKAWLLAKKDELIQDVFGPLLDIAERFTRGIFPQPLAYRDGELGYQPTATGWVSEATFGGARKAITHAALQCALGATSPCRIVVMDELKNVDETNIRPLLFNVREAHEAGLIDQFIGIRPEPLDSVSGFTHWEATGKDYAVTYRGKDR